MPHENRGDKAKRFLRQNQMNPADIEVEYYVRFFLNEIQEGLAGRGSSLQMIPTHVEVDRDIPRSKTVIVLDAGGLIFGRRRSILTHLGGRLSRASAGVLCRMWPGSQQRRFTWPRSASSCLWLERAIAIPMRARK